MRRVRWIDIAKGIGILLVTIGHSRFGESGWSAIWINSFHMPLFFVMAGLCYDERRYASYWAYLKRKGVALAYPYFMLTLFVAILMTCACVGSDTNYFAEYFVRHPFPGWTIGGFWFIRVLIVVELIYALLSHGVINSAFLRGGCVLFALGAFWQPDWYCLRMNTILVSLAFYGLGHAMRSVLEKPIQVKKVAIGSLASLLVQVLLIGICAKMVVGYGGCKVGNPLCFYPIAICGVAFVSGISMLLDTAKGCLEFLPKSLAWLGKYSVLLLAIHGSCGVCRHSWAAKWSMLAGWPSQMLEIGLLVALMWLLSGPLNFFMKLPKFTKWSRNHETA